LTFSEAVAQRDTQLAAPARIAEQEASQHALVRKMVLTPDEATKAPLLAIDTEVTELQRAHR
jgi:hypothetical protein